MSLKKITSIRSQLMKWLLFPLLILVVFSIYSSSHMATSFANRAFDDGLEELARAIAGNVEFDDGHWHLASPQLSKNIGTHQKDEEIRFSIRGPEGDLIAGTEDLGRIPLGITYPHFRNAIFENREYRVVAVKVPLNDNTYLYVQAAETLLGRKVLAHQILINTIVHQLVLLLLAMLCVWWGVKQGIKPLAKLKKEIEDRTPGDFTKLDEKEVPKEIQPMVSALNSLMDKQSSYSESQKRFVANAAHQLRTPLAGLRMQVELAQRQENPQKTKHALEQIELGTDHGVDLVESLLLLSKMEPSILQQEDFEEFDLIDLARQSIESFQTQAKKKNVKLSLEKFKHEEAMLYANSFSVNELLSNLLDNAIKYTPRDGEVSVEVDSSRTTVTLSVKDSGPGIPDSEKEKVFERFYRSPDASEEGNGLGLSIVKEIINSHKAKVEISDVNNNQGTCVKVTFVNEV
jgi:two-component system sensor histidine kinase TctE